MLLGGCVRPPPPPTTTYQIRQVFDGDETPPSPLDAVPEASDEVFGSYHRLVKLDTFRFRKRETTDEHR